MEFFWVHEGILKSKRRTKAGRADIIIPYTTIQINVYIVYVNHTKYDRYWHRTEPTFESHFLIDGLSLNYVVWGLCWEISCILRHWVDLNIKSDDAHSWELYKSFSLNRNVFAKIHSILANITHLVHSKIKIAIPNLDGLSLRNKQMNDATFQHQHQTINATSNS